MDVLIAGEGVFDNRHASVAWVEAALYSLNKLRFRERGITDIALHDDIFLYSAGHYVRLTQERNLLRVSSNDPEAAVIPVVFVVGFEGD